MADSPAILAIDTATGPCSAAVWRDGRLAAYVENIRPTQQSASLMPMVEEALGIAGLSYNDLSLIACTTGPGSFTGIRVGLAAASGIAFAARVAGAGFTSLEVLAFAALKTRKKEDIILAVLNAGKGEYYVQPFSPAPFAALDDAKLMTPQQAAEAFSGRILQCDNVAPLSPAHADAMVPFPRADALAELAAVKQSSLALRPFYIRGPDAKLPGEVAKKIKKSI